MTQKRIREFEKLLKADGLQFTKPKAEGLRIWTEVRAENGAKKMFSIATEPGDVRAELNERGRWRRWTRQNGTLDLPFMEPTDLELAARAVIHEKDPEFMGIVKKKFEHSGFPFQIDGRLLAQAVEEVPPHDMPQGVQPSTEEIDDALADDDLAILESQPTQEPTMPRTLQLAKPTLDTPIAATPPVKRRQIMRIGQVEFFKLCTILNEIDMVGISSYPKLAEKLTKAYGKPVAVTTAEDACKATGKRLDKVMVDATEAQVIIARTLTALLIRLSEPVPDDLRKLCGETA